MGWFFAPGLKHLELIQPEELPLAWALTGFTSVAASPLAVILSISLGFPAAAIIGLLLYLLCYPLALMAGKD
jgi:hypothetical protein